MNVQIIRSDVEKAARSIKSAADQVAKIDFGSPLAKIAGAMTGGVSPGAANGLKGEWKADQDKWVKAANGHHDRTLDDANRIVETDDTGDIHPAVFLRRGSHVEEHTLNGDPLLDFSTAEHRKQLAGLLEGPLT
jgi:hypothetical protein